MTESNNSNLAPDSNISVPVVEEGSGKPTVESTTEVSSPVKPDAKSDAKSGSTATGAVEATSTEMKDEVSNEGDHRREQRPRVSLVVPDATGGSDVSTHKPLKHPNRLMPKGLSTLGDEMPQYTRSVTTASGSQSGWNATKRGWNAKKDRSKILGRAMTHQVGSNYDRELHWLKPYYPSGKGENDIEEEESWIPDWVMYFPSMFSSFLHVIVNEFPWLMHEAGILLKFFGTGFQAYIMFMRLIVFAILIMPAVVKVGSWWTLSPNVLRGIRYGPNGRNQLDIYLPADYYLDPPEKRRQKKLPIVINVMGGAWVIGFRAWSACMGRRLAFERGALFVAPDYRNFPQGKIDDMVEDVNNCINWVFENADRYGGDISNVILTGQSAGAHIVAMLLINKAIKEEKAAIKNVELNQMWSLSNIRAFVGISGPYDMVSIVPHLNSRGLYSNVVMAMMGNDLFRVSPTRILSESTGRSKAAMHRLPEIYLFHGDSDVTVPIESSVQFKKALQYCGVQHVTFKVLPGCGHSDPIVECPIRGGKDPLIEQLVPIVFAKSPLLLESRVGQALPMMNTTILAIASAIMPF